MWNTIFAIGRNYVAHAHELGNEIPTQPVIFSKTGSSITEQRRFSFPPHLGAIHYELELVFEIGRDCPLGSYVEGPIFSRIGLGIDFTARDLQSQLKSKGLPWDRAKSFQNSCFLGPLQAYRDWQTLHFQLLRGDLVLQDGDPHLMIFKPETILKTLNQFLPLKRGDLVYSGTPEGVGPVMKPDTLRLVCQGLGLDFTIQIEA